jgi:carbonic anhydrase/acetyltransferase-like protein (isoleucine patch superfamily)
VVYGQSLTVTWAAQNANSRSYVIKTSSGTVVAGPFTSTLSGNVTVASFTDLGPGTYVRTDTVTGPGGTATCSATLTVTQPQSIPTCTVSYSPTTVVYGQSLTVTWGAQNATSRSYIIKTSSGTVVAGPFTSTLSGNVTVASFTDLGPGTYVRTDTVTGPGGTATCSATLTVT